LHKNRVIFVNKNVYF